MSDNHRLIKDVSYALKHYIEITRKEEGFDTSASYVPAYDLNRYKFNTLFGYSTTSDKGIKHNFEKSGFKRILSEEANKREKYFRNEIIYHLHRGEPKKKQQQSQRANSSKPSIKQYHSPIRHEPKINRSKSAIKPIRPSSRYIPLGLLSVRSKIPPYLTKGERSRVIETTSMILSATDDIFKTKDGKNSTTTQKSQKFYSPRRDNANNNLDNSGKKNENIDDHSNNHRPSDIDTHLRSSKSRENEQYLAEYVRVNAERDREEEYHKYREEELLKKQQKLDENNEQIEVTEGEKLNSYEYSETTKYNKKSHVTKKFAGNYCGTQTEITVNAAELELINSKEVTIGSKIKYRVIVQTGAKPGSSTKANIKLRLFGEKYDGVIKCSKWIDLEKSSTHKIPFQRGNEDIFDIEICDIGKLCAITIGHMESDIKYSWFLETVTIVDPHLNLKYEFKFDKWFSESASDKKNIRTAFVTGANYVPEPKSKTAETVAVIHNYKIASEMTEETIENRPQKEEEDDKLTNINAFQFDKKFYKPRDSITTSIKANVSSSSASSGEEEENKQRKDKYSSTSSTASQTPSSSRSQASTDKAKPKKPQSASSRDSRGKNKGLNQPSKVKDGRYSQASSSSSSSSTLEPPKNSETKKFKIIRSSSSSSSSSSDRRAALDDKKALGTTESRNNNNNNKFQIKEQVEETTVKKSVTIIKNRRNERRSSSDSSSSSSDSVSSTQMRSANLELEKNKRDQSLAVQLILQNRLDDLKELIKESPKIVLTINSDGETLLTIACQRCHNKIVRYLIENEDILISTDTPLGLYPIHYCAKYDNLEGLTILVDNGALVDTQANDGSTAMHYAAMNGYLDMCKYLISKKADLEIRDDNSRTAYDLAVANKHEKIAELLKHAYEPSKNQDNEQHRLIGFAAQVSMVSSINERELFENISRAEKPIAESPFVRPGRPSPKIRTPVENEINYASQSDSELPNKAVQAENNIKQEFKAPASDNIISKRSVSESTSSLSSYRNKAETKTDDTNLGNKNENSGLLTGKLNDTLSDRSSSSSYLIQRKEPIAQRKKLTKSEDEFDN